MAFRLASILDEYSWVDQLLEFTLRGSRGGSR